MRYLIFLFCFFPLFLFGQLQTINGNVQNTNNEALPGCIIQLLRNTDSLMIKNTVTDANGKFEIPGIVINKSYIIKTTLLGYKTNYLAVNINETKPAIQTIILKVSAREIETINVEGKALAVTIKGDTTEINSDSYKVNKDASGEDLVTKMPGVQVQDGKVQAQGEDVKQVLVDGKAFFGEDPNAVLKNIPAEVIERIQVFDKRTDQSSFTGFDDGNSSKTINIITRPQFRNGTFGRVYAGAGTDDRYKVGGVINKFKDNKRFTIIGQSNNINEQNFTQDDLSGVLSASGGSGRGGMGGGRGGMGGGGRPGGMGGGRGGTGQGGDGSQFIIDPKNGITTTHAIGINYTDKWKTKTDVSGSYFFNFNKNIFDANTQRIYATTQNENLVYNEQTNSTSENMMHRFNFKVEHKFDSLHSYIIQPRIAFQNSNTDNSTLGLNTATTKTTGTTSNAQVGENLNYNASVMMLYRHAFVKRGRTFSIGATPTISNGNSENILKSNNTVQLADTNFNTSLNQKSTLDKNALNINANINYTEPLDTNHSLSWGYTLATQQNDAVKETYNYGPIKKDYVIFNPLLSNTTNSDYIANGGEMGYRFQKSKWNISAGVNYQYATLKNKNATGATTDFNKSFTNILPNAMLMYRWNTRQNMRFNYRTYTNMPGVEQLQPVLNNSNPLFLTIGNIDLNQDLQHNLMLRYSSINPLKNTSLFWLGGFTFINNYISNQTFIGKNDSNITTVNLPPGAQLSQPINVNGYYNARTFLSYGFPVKFLKSNLNINASANYTSTPAKQNNKMNITTSPSASLGLVLSSNISDKVDFTISSTSSGNAVRNDIDSRLNQDFYRQISKVRINVVVWKNINISSEATHNYNKGLGSSFNESFLIWNAGAGYKFLKNNIAEIRFSVYDILNENRNIQRNVTETYLEDVRSNALQRFFMLTFTYKISKTFAKK